MRKSAWHCEISLAGEWTEGLDMRRPVREVLPHCWGEAVGRGGRGEKGERPLRWQEVESAALGLALGEESEGLRATPRCVASIICRAVGAEAGAPLLARGCPGSDWGTRPGWDKGR